MVSTLYTSPNAPWSPATYIPIKQQGFHSPVRRYQKINREPKCAKYSRNNKGLTTLWCSYKIHENQRGTCACHVPSTQGAMKLSLEVWEILTPAIESYTNSGSDGHQAWNLEFYVCTAVIRQGPSQWTDSRRKALPSGRTAERGR